MNGINPKPFDEKLQTPEMRAFKAVIPYMEPSIGKMAAVMIKMLEIKAIMESFESTIAVCAEEEEKRERFLSALLFDEKNAEAIEMVQKAREMKKFAEMMSLISAMSSDDESKREE